MLLAGCMSRETMRDTQITGDDVQIVGHRGCAGQYPENTVLAMKRSAPHVDMIEIDVQRCGSGELIVFHDDTLDHLTEASGSVASTDWETIRELTVGDSEQTIPRLATVLDAIPTDTGVNIELKHVGIADDVLAIAAQIDNTVLYSSFQPAALSEVQTVDPTANCALLFADASEKSVQTAIDLDCTAIHPRYDLVLTTDLMKTARKNGFRVNTWTISDSDVATELIQTGVDGLIVDYWNLEFSSA
ncbi:glycerophosphoryl diester phosphodiesterase [Halohasta litchfieldiae]|nr:glycerophosphoryl diester phosphodiesterase [Halohasta litchfieldiae]